MTFLKLAMQRKEVKGENMHLLKNTFFFYCIIFNETAGQCGKINTLYQTDHEVLSWEPQNGTLRKRKIKLSEE